MGAVVTTDSPDTLLGYLEGSEVRGFWGALPTETTLSCCCDPVSASQAPSHSTALRVFIDVYFTWFGGFLSFFF